MTNRSITPPNADVSDKEVIAILQAESEVYRTTVQVALELLVDAEKRFKNAQKLNQEYRRRERAANEHNTHR